MLLVTESQKISREKYDEWKESERRTSKREKGATEERKYSEEEQEK